MSPAHVCEKFPGGHRCSVCPPCTRYRIDVAAILDGGGSRYDLVRDMGLTMRAAVAQESRHKERGGGVAVVGPQRGRKRGQYRPAAPILESEDKPIKGKWACLNGAGGCGRCGLRGQHECIPDEAVKCETSAAGWVMPSW